MNRRTLIKSLAALPFLDVKYQILQINRPDVKTAHGPSEGAGALVLRTDASYVVVIDENAVGDDTVFAIDKTSPLVDASIFPLKVPAGKTIQEVFAIYEIEGKSCPRS